MPRKQKKVKEPKKVKNIVQQVVVKIGADGKRITKRRKRSAPKKGTDNINIMATIPPNVIYQSSAPYVPPVPPSMPPVPASSGIKLGSMPAPISTASAPIIPPSSSIGVGTEELPTTASFAPNNIVRNSPVEVYTKEPESFKSSVSGNLRFGVPETPVNIHNNSISRGETETTEIQTPRLSLRMPEPEPVSPTLTLNRTELLERGIRVPTGEFNIDVPLQGMGLVNLKRLYKERFGRNPKKGMKKADIIAALS